MDTDNDGHLIVSIRLSQGVKGSITDDALRFRMKDITEELIVAANTRQQ